MTATSGRRVWLLALGGLMVLVLLGLGVWQVQRLGWKTDLIARTEAALSADPVQAPSPADLAATEMGTEMAPGETFEYRRVAITGRYLPDAQVLVQAVTDLGAGDWVMTGFETDAGWRLLVNRGFVPQGEEASLRPAPAGPVTVTGLMRATQPDGAFLRDNDPEGGRWFSRDTKAIAQTLGLGPVAPWFLDRAAGAEDGYPVGGLTVVSFPNNHLSYALTWFAMALALAAVIWWTGLRRD